MLRKFLLPLFVLLSVCACDSRAMIAENTPPDILNYVNQFFDTVRQGDLAALEHMTRESPGITKADRIAALKAMIKLFPKETPDSFEVLGLNWTIRGSSNVTNLMIEYRIGKPSIIANIRVVKLGPDNFRVETAFFEVIATSFAEFNAFTLEDKPLASYLILAGNILVLTLMAMTFVVILRRPNLKRRWKALWCFLSLVVLFKAQVNWTTSEIEYVIAHFGIFPIGISRESYSGPWYFATWLPVGAILFWLIRPGRGQRVPKVDLSTFD